MALGGFLFLIFVLYLIDKHNLWRKAVKVTLWLLAFCVFIGVGVFGWRWHTQRQAEAESVAEAARMKPIWDCETRNSQFSNVIEECEKDSSVILHAVAQEPTPQPTPKPKPYGNAEIVPDSELLFGCNSAVLITTVYHGTRVKIISDASLGGVKVQIPDGRIGCLLEKDAVQQDKSKQ
jgi:hypothetical protein